MTGHDDRVQIAWRYPVATPGRRRSRAMSSGTSCRARPNLIRAPGDWPCAAESRKPLFCTSNERLPYRFSRETSARRLGRSRLMSIVSSHDRTNDQISFQSRQREIRLEADLFRDVCGRDIPSLVIQECVFPLRVNSGKVRASIAHDSCIRFSMADDPSTKVQAQAIPKRASRRPDRQQPT